jgi:hypothetical protein
VTRVQKILCQQILSQNYQEDHKMQKGVNIWGQIQVFESRVPKSSILQTWGPKLHFPQL